jgi:integrase
MTGRSVPRSARRKRRPRGHIEELPYGKFRAIVYAGVDPLTGKERRLREITKTHDEAEVALTRMLHQVDEELHPKSSVTLGEAIEQWLDVAELEVTTRERYEDLIRLYIAPRLGAQQAARLDAELLERFYARLHRCRDLCGGRPPKGHVCRPLSTSTTRKIHYIIRGALGNAVRWRYLSVNPAELANAPSPRKTKPDPPSPQEAAALLGEAWSDPEWGLLLWLTMITGFRRGELCSLRWRHLDEARACLWVQRSTAQPTRAAMFEKDTKTETERRISLDPQTMTLLAAHKARAAAQCAQLGLDLDQEAFLFSAAPDYSTPLLPRSVTQRYRRMAARLELRSTRLHSLRHYSATELLAAGVDLRTVAGRLGHGSGGATTLKVYAAWVEHADRKAADTIAQIIPTPQPRPRKPKGPYESIAADLRGPDRVRRAPAGRPAAHRRPARRRVHRRRRYRPSRHGALADPRTDHRDQRAPRHGPAPGACRADRRLTVGRPRADHRPAGSATRWHLMARDARRLGLVSMSHSKDPLTEDHRP